MEIALDRIQGQLTLKNEIIDDLSKKNEKLTSDFQKLMINHEKLKN